MPRRRSNAATAEIEGLAPNGTYTPEYKKRVLKEMQKKNLTFSAMSKTTGVSPQTIQHWAEQAGIVRAAKPGEDDEDTKRKARFAKEVGKPNSKRHLSVVGGSSTRAKRGPFLVILVPREDVDVRKSTVSLERAVMFGNQ